MSGSKLADRYYREGRVAGLNPGRAVLRVYMCGVVHGAPRNELVTQDEATALLPVVEQLYVAEKRAGRTHGEALDEVLLAGYVRGRGFDVRLSDLVSL